MVAIIGLPGSRHHQWERFTSKRDAREWIARTLDEYHDSGETAAFPLPTEIVSEREASRRRYRDGSRCYPEGVTVDGVFIPQ